MHYLGSQYLLQEIINRNTFSGNSFTEEKSFLPDLFFFFKLFVFNYFAVEICCGSCTAKEEKIVVFEVPASIRKFADKIRMH